MSTSCWWRIFFFFCSWLLNPPWYCTAIVTPFYTIWFQWLPQCCFSLPRVLFTTSSSSISANWKQPCVWVLCSLSYGRLASENKLISEISSFSTTGISRTEQEVFSIHSLIHGEMWWMTEAATCAGFPLVRCIFILPSPHLYIAFKMLNESLSHFWDTLICLGRLGFVLLPVLCCIILFLLYLSSLPEVFLSLVLSDLHT